MSRANLCSKSTLTTRCVRSFFFFQAEDGIRDYKVTGVQTCALPICSDQYSFIKAGIPALAMKVGYEPNSPEAEIARTWTAERYHAPSDDLNQPIDRAAAGAFVDVLRTLAVRVANRPDRPKWNPESFF